MEETKQYTADTIVEEIRPHQDEMLRALEENEEVPVFLKASSHFKRVWLAGCWLRMRLEEAGAPEERVKKIGFEHGQRSFHHDTYRVAAELFNQFQDGVLQENPGDELAAQLLEESVSVREEGGKKVVVMRVASSDEKALMESEVARINAMSPEEREAYRKELEEVLSGEGLV